MRNTLALPHTLSAGYGRLAALSCRLCWDLQGGMQGSDQLIRLLPEPGPAHHDSQVQIPHRADHGASGIRSLLRVQLGSGCQKAGQCVGVSPDLRRSSQCQRVKSARLVGGQ